MWEINGYTCLFSAVFVLGTGAVISKRSDQSNLVKPKTVNVPINMYTDGNVGNPPYDFPAHTDEETFWTIINNSGCPINYRQWFDGADLALNPLGPKYIAGTLGSSIGSSVIYTYGNVRSLWMPNTIQNIQYAIFDFNVPPSTTWATIGMGTHDVKTGFTGGCDCMKAPMS
ncbi:MAG: hypothetical protein GC180_05365 [Bacteroidetes bacterium]|nr:hypothetical protein [Bacteroidota bacterium]